MAISGICECGCGQQTYIAPRTYSRRGWFKGQPKRFVSGHNWRGKKRSESERQALSRNKTGDRNHNWKGDDVGYQSLHIWLRKHYSKSGSCEECKKVCRTHWANISGKYRRSRDDFKELCSSCHKLFDGAEARGNSLAAINKVKTHCIHGHAFDANNTRIWNGHRLCIKCQRAAHLRHRARPDVKAKRAERARADREASLWP